MTTRVTGERGDHIYLTHMELGMVRVVEMLGNRKIRDVLLAKTEVEFHTDIRNLADEGGYKWMGEELHPQLRNNLLGQIISSLSRQLRKKRREERLASFEHAVICDKYAWRHCSKWTEKILICMNNTFLFVPSKFAFTYLEYRFVYTPAVKYNTELQRHEVSRNVCVTEPISGRRIGDSINGEKQAHDNAMKRLASFSTERVREVISQAAIPYDFPEPDSD